MSEDNLNTYQHESESKPNLRKIRSPKQIEQWKYVQLRHVEYLIERKASKLGIYENYMKMKKR